MPIYSKPNDWGGNSISRELYNYLISSLPEGKTILELGSGWGTSKLLERWNVWSIENNKKWFKTYNDQSFLVPLKNGWYDCDILKKALIELSYDLLLIDGPYHNREGFISNFYMFDNKVIMVFDDVKKKEGRNIIEEVSKLSGRKYVILGEGRSMFGVIDL